MDTITVTFQFAPGDLVYFRAAHHGHGSRPNRFCIETRIAEECHGGIQIMYKLVGSDKCVPELALSATEPAYNPKSDEAIGLAATENKKELDAFSNI